MASCCRPALAVWIFLAALVARQSAYGQLIEDSLCECTDVDPRQLHDGVPMDACFLQREWGKCEEEFMFDTVKELPEGYCEITCGRCTCCSTFREIAEAEGLFDYILAMDGVGLSDKLDNPGWMVSVLAPPPGQILAWMQDRGFDFETLALDEEAIGSVRALLNIHTINPVPDILTVWTSPFFLDMAILETQEQGKLLSVSRDVLGNVIFNGPGNSAQLIGADRETCKGNIQLIDNLLVLEPQVTAPALVSTAGLIAPVGTEETGALGTSEPLEGQGRRRRGSRGATVENTTTSATEIPNTVGNSDLQDSVPGQLPLGTEETSSPGADTPQEGQRRGRNSDTTVSGIATSAVDVTDTAGSSPLLDSTPGQLPSITEETGSLGAGEAEEGSTGSSSQVTTVAGTITSTTEDTEVADNETEDARSRLIAGLLGGTGG